MILHLKKLKDRLIPCDDESEINDVEIQPDYVNPKLNQPLTKTTKRRAPSKKEMKAQEFAEANLVPEHDVDTGEVFPSKPNINVLDGIGSNGLRTGEMGS